ncbi:MULTISPECIES: tail protein X [unclassified Variovorax]|uniref:tail protein X n=1 Tax=unclassified Variovorax TaxID=663243 RepID=UPI000BD668D5|nr:MULTISPECIES: tail protein X [unclassified Variovorax]NVM87465.1 phage tail protein X [Variovorax sp. SG517]SOD27673.1 P2-like prophage tail protein X [Variovorax sp. YR752]
MQVRTQQNDTVDLLCWRYLQRTQGVVEATLLLNPGLADRGPILPAGLLVELAEPASTTTRRTVQLWD